MSKARPAGDENLVLLGQIGARSRFCSQISASRPVFNMLIGVIAPPLTVASLAVMQQSTPLTSPTPPTTEEPLTSPFMPWPASAAISKKKLS